MNSPAKIPLSSPPGFPTQPPKTYHQEPLQPFLYLRLDHVYLQLEPLQALLHHLKDYAHVQLGQAVLHLLQHPAQVSLLCPENYQYQFPLVHLKALLK